MSLRSARIVVTGGAGLVGSAIVDQLVAEGADVVVYDSFIRGKMEHLEEARRRGKVQVIQADLRDRDKLRDAIRGMDYVVHQAAAWLRACQQEPRLSIDVNIVGSFNLLEACVDAGVKKVVAATSSSV
jgi:UDP-glucose 4-epimerase